MSRKTYNRRRRKLGQPEEGNPTPSAKAKRVEENLQSPEAENRTAGGGNPTPSAKAKQGEIILMRKAGRQEMEFEELTERVIGCAIAVHRAIDPGFLEGIYGRALLVEFRHATMTYEFQAEHPVFYRNEEVGRQRFDILVEGRLIVELKAVKALEDIHFAQVRSYLKALNLKHGLLLNLQLCHSRLRE